MTYTNEQLAIRQHLAKPEPYCGACGCMGPRYIDPSQVTDDYRFTVDTTKVVDMVLAIKAIRIILKNSLREAKAMFDAGSFTFVNEWMYKAVIVDTFEKAGMVVTVETAYNKFPVCPCAMQYVEEVDGKFYEIETLRSVDGISHVAKLLGPVGGPYNKV